MENIEKHIEEDKKILEDPTTNPQMRRHIEGRAEQLERYQKSILRIIMILRILNCIAKIFPNPTSVESTKTNGIRKFLSRNSQFLGRDGFKWWVGQIAPLDAQTEQLVDGEGWSHRYKVRIMGYHPFTEEIPNEELPWGQALLPTTSWIWCSKLC